MCKWNTKSDVGNLIQHDSECRQSADNVTNMGDLSDKTRRVGKQRETSCPRSLDRHVRTRNIRPAVQITIDCLMGRWSDVLDSACSMKGFEKKGKFDRRKARARMWCDVSLFCDFVRACGGDSEWRQEQVFWLLTLRTDRANSWGDCVSAHVELESCLVRNNRAWILHSQDVVIVHLDTYAHDTFLAWNKAFWQTLICRVFLEE